MQFECRFIAIAPINFILAETWVGVQNLKHCRLSQAVELPVHTKERLRMKNDDGV